MTHTPANTPASGGDAIAPGFCFRPKDSDQDWIVVSVRDGVVSYRIQGVFTLAPLTMPLDTFREIADALAAQPPQADGVVVPAKNPKAAIPPEDSEERSFWLEAAEQHGFGEVNHGVYAGKEGALLKLMAAARQQGWDDALAAAPPLNTGPEVGGGYRYSEPKEWPHWSCPACRCKSFARVHEQKPDKSFGDGPLIRCIECKETFDTRPPVPAEAGEDLAGLSARAAALRNFLTRHLNDRALADYDNIVAQAFTTPASRPAEQGEPVASVEQVVSRLIIANPDKARQAIQTPEKWGWFCGRIAESGISYEVGKQHLYALLSALEAPAASRPAVGREEIARVINPEAFQHGSPDYYGPDEVAAWCSAGQRIALRRADQILRLISDPRDDARDSA